MAQFDLSQYETVEQRHARAIEAHPELRCVIVNHTTPADRSVGMWVVEARVYLNADDQAKDLPKATDWAFEIDGQGLANKTSALENASTSALGRALRWAFAGSKGASREEMAKVERGVSPVSPKRDWLTEADVAQAEGNVQALRLLYADAVAAKVDEVTIATIRGYGSSIAPDSAGKSGRTSRAN